MFAASFASASCAGGENIMMIQNGVNSVFFFTIYNGGSCNVSSGVVGWRDSFIGNGTDLSADIDGSGAIRG